MRRENHITVYLRVVAICLILCSHTVWSAEKLNVVVSIKPIHSLVAGLMKDVNKPTLLIDGMQTPYDFELSAAQEKHLKDSTLLFWVGAELEKSLESVVKQLPEKVTVVELLSSPGMKILPSRKNDELRDPFFWMDDRNIMILLDELTEALIQVDPERSHIYIRNRFEMLKPLRTMDKEFEYSYRGMKGGMAVQYFDTLRYFEQAYALNILDHVTGSPWDDQDAIGILKVRARLKNDGVSCLFLDRSMSADNLDLLTEGYDLRIGWLDTLGMQLESGPDLYLDLMKYNNDVIRECLNVDDGKTVKQNIASLTDNVPVRDALGGRFILKNHLGQLFTEQDMKGHYSLIFFGYTFCPDVCPTSLMVLTQAFQKMGDLANRIHPYFISVDPERDTVKVLKDYVAYFDSRLVGLTGSKLMIKRVADQFKAKYEKNEVEDGGRPDRYTMDHTSGLYLMAPDGSFVAKFAHGISSDTLVNELKTIIR